MVHLQAILVIRELRIKSLKLVIGGSLGGMQVLEWALLYPDMVRAIAPMATSGRHSPWCIGLSEAQRQAKLMDELHQVKIHLLAFSITYSKCHPVPLNHYENHLQQWILDQIPKSGLDGK